MNNICLRNTGCSIRSHNHCKCKIKHNLKEKCGNNCVVKNILVKEPKTIKYTKNVTEMFIKKYNIEKFFMIDNKLYDLHKTYHIIFKMLQKSDMNFIEE